jgi:hypothetical protein
VLKSRFRCVRETARLSPIRARVPGVGRLVRAYRVILLFYSGRDQPPPRATRCIYNRERKRRTGILPAQDTGSRRMRKACVCVTGRRDEARGRGTRRGRATDTAVCVCVLRADGTRHADGARVGDAQQTRRGHARSSTHTNQASGPSTPGSVKAPACVCVMHC